MPPNRITFIIYQMGQCSSVAAFLDTQDNLPFVELSHCRIFNLSCLPNKFRFILSFSPKTSFVSKIFRTFATLSAHCGWEPLIVGWSRWAGHYILKGVTDALFLDFRNYHNRITVKNIAGVTAAGCVYQTP